MTYWLILVSSFFGLNCYSSTLLSNSYPFQPSVIKEIEDKVLVAKDRSAEAMQEAFFFNINPYLKVACPPHQPTTDGRGCYIYFDFGAIGSMNIKVRKELLVLGTYQKIQARLKSLDPGSYLLQVHFGSIFTASTSMASDFYCWSNHAKDGWDCSLLVREAPF